MSRTIDRGLWGLALIAFAITAYASLLRNTPDLLDIPDQDKVGHAAAYFAVLLPLLFAAVWRPGRGDGIFPGGTPWLAAGLLVVGVGFEGLQALVTTTRSPEALDVGAEVLGVAAAVGVFRLVRGIRPTRSIPHPAG